jgi:hypothetical protein
MPKHASLILPPPSSFLRRCLSLPQQRKERLFAWLSTSRRQREKAVDMCLRMLNRPQSDSWNQTCWVNLSSVQVRRTEDSRSAQQQCPAACGTKAANPPKQSPNMEPPKGELYKNSSMLPKLSKSTPSSPLPTSPPTYPVDQAGPDTSVGRDHAFLRHYLSASTRIWNWLSLSRLLQRVYFGA